jgi:hypothetical protein
MIGAATSRFQGSRAAAGGGDGPISARSPSPSVETPTERLRALLEGSDGSWRSEPVRSQATPDGAAARLCDKLVR